MEKINFNIMCETLEFISSWILIFASGSTIKSIYKIFLKIVPQAFLIKITNDLALKSNYMAMKYTNNPFLISFAERIIAPLNSSIKVFGNLTVQILTIIVIAIIFLIIMIVKNIVINTYNRYLWYPKLKPIWDKILKKLHIRV